MIGFAPWVGLAWMGCIEPSVPITPSVSSTSTTPSLLLEDIDDGYHCDVGFYMAFDDARTVRLGVNAWWDRAHPPSTTLDVALRFYDTAPLEEGVGRLNLWHGQCLATPGCSDAYTVSCRQRITEVWTATEGRAALQHDGELVWGEATDVRLERFAVDEDSGERFPHPEATPPVELDLIELAPRARWQPER
ncbi:MAG: hypothetical protein KTR31_31525 [Myxococcales bacterium]|nr:hypothetical protein [Myxococcales bacterium]